jgi:hypothetical protein
MGIIIAGFAWQVNRMAAKIDALEKQDSALELKVAEDYITKLEFHSFESRLNNFITEQFKEVKELLRNKQDKE